jgi:hypothetical protein
MLIISFRSIVNRRIQRLIPNHYRSRNLARSPITPTHPVDNPVSNAPARTQSEHAVISTFDLFSIGGEYNT